MFKVISEINIEKIGLFISIILGYITATNLYLDRKVKVSLLSNKTNLNFITSDQPVINLSEEKNENGYIKYFKLY